MGQAPDLRQNRLLAVLPQEEYEPLLPYLEWVALELRHILYDLNEPIPAVYFPLSGMVSLLSLLKDDSFIEVGTTGNEGMVGLPLLLGVDRIPGRAIAQVPGEAMRLTPAAFQQAVVPGSVLYGLLQRYNQALFNQMAQTAVCNRVHSIEERFCRWMLIVHDRVAVDEFPLTQEFLAQMLGPRRG